MIKRKLIFIILMVVLVFSGCSSNNSNYKSAATNHSSSIQSTTNTSANTSLGQYSLTKREVIEKLSSKEFEGRLIGTEGNQKAGEYISKLFGEIGLQKSENGSYLQEFKYSLMRNNEDSEKIKTENQLTAYNIVGKIPGKNHKSCIVISAHYDHMGVRNGALNAGAIDNCSGVSILIDIANKLVKEASVKSPENDIYICAFNGEEIGLKGSYAMVDTLKARYDKITDINIECIEGLVSKKIILVGEPIAGSNLIDNIKTSFEKLNLLCEAVGNKYGSDHLAFTKFGLSAVTVGQEATDTMHTPNDTPDKINYEFLDEVSESLYLFLKEII